MTTIFNNLILIHAWTSETTTAKFNIFICGAKKEQNKNLRTNLDGRINYMFINTSKHSKASSSKIIL